MSDNKGQTNKAFEFPADTLESLRAEQAETNLRWAKNVAEANVEIERLREEGQQLRDEWQKALIDASVSRDRMQEALFDKAVAGGKVRIARNAALEEAAKVAEQPMAVQRYANDIPPAIAAAIRALKEKS